MKKKKKKKKRQNISGSIEACGIKVSICSQLKSTCKFFRSRTLGVEFVLRVSSMFFSHVAIDHLC